MNHKKLIRKLRFLITVVLMSASVLTISAQQISVTGVVRDVASGEPLLGVNILEKGTSNGTITNMDGEFSISVSSNATLVFRYVGYTLQEVKVAGRKNINVSLTEDAVTIGEVLVIGYGTVKKNDLTGSVVAIKPDEMNRGLNTNAQDMIMGKIAGVNITSGGGTPGGGSTIRIRGESSLSANKDPLIVVDGLAMDNKGIKGAANLLGTINPNDIESVTVLKDASATAIYGSRASTGVIIITTKKGTKNQKPRISYNGNASLSTVAKTYDVFTGDEYRALVNQMYADDPDVLAKLGTANTDWQSQIYRPAFGQDHNVSVTGGVKNIPYRVSVGYTNLDGILKTSEYQRLTASGSISPTFFDDHLKVNVNAKGMYMYNQYAETGAIGSAITMDPTQPVMSDQEPYQTSFGGYWQWYNTISDKVWFNSNAVRNPLSTLMLKSDKANSYDFIGSVDADYKLHFLPEMRVHLNMGMEKAYGKQDLLIPITAASDHNWGRTGWEDISKTNQSLNLWTQYAKEIDEHSFDIMAGYEWQHFYREEANEYMGLVRSDSNEDGIIDETDDFYDPKSKLFKTESYLVSFFSRANYNLSNKYLLTGTVRFDGSSQFNRENRWGIFPSGAFAWKVIEEDFIKDIDVISDLKLSVGFGVTGQQDIGQGDYSYIPVYESSITGAYYPFGTTEGTLDYQETYRPNVYNSKLKWEETTTWNAGLDFGFFGQRLTGRLDYYFRQTKDLLAVIDIPMGTNFSNRVVTNIGSLENHGLELMLDARIISQKDFSWEVNFNAARNRNMITKLTSGTGEGYYVGTGGISSGVGSNAQAHAVGHPAYSFYVYEQIYDDNGKPIEGEFKDRNEDGIVNSDDLYFYKNPRPDLTLGLSSKLIYKAFDFSFTMRASLGNYMYNDRAAGSHNMSVTGIWSPLGYFINKPASALETNFTGNAANAHFSDYYVQDASFLRVDNISLGYSFNKVFDVISGGRVYVNVQNPFVVTKYSGMDPEKFDGIDNDLYPRPIVTMIGLSLNF